MVALRTIPGVLLAESCPDVLSGRLYPLLDAADTIQGRANVEREDGRPIGLRGRRVVVDDIADFFARSPLDYPVVSVEWRLSTAAR